VTDWLHLVTSCHFLLKMDCVQARLSRTSRQGAKGPLGNCVATERLRAIATETEPRRIANKSRQRANGLLNFFSNISCCSVFAGIRQMRRVSSCHFLFVPRGLCKGALIQGISPGSERPTE
jgi:hypothetical protein